MNLRGPLVAESSGTVAQDNPYSSNLMRGLTDLHSFSFSVARLQDLG